MSVEWVQTTAAAAKLLQSCRILCDPIDGSPLASRIPGILQARTLEWVAISFSNAWKWKVKVKSLSRVRLFATPWTAAHQASPSMGFSRQEYWSGVPLPSPSTTQLKKQKPNSIKKISQRPKCVFLWRCHRDSHKEHEKMLSIPSSLVVCGLVAKSCLTIVTPWTVACQAPLSVGFSRQEYWSGLHFLLQNIFQTQELNPGLLHCRPILYQLSYEGRFQFFKKGKSNDHTDQIGHIENPQQ